MNHIRKKESYGTKKNSWWPMVKNPSSNAGNTGLIPGQGARIPHAVEQLSLCITTRESQSMAMKTLCSQKEKKGGKKNWKFKI